MVGIIDSMGTSLSKLWETVEERSLVCCSPRGCKESDITEQLNNNNKRAALTTVTMILISYVVADAPSLTGMQAPVVHHKEEL